MGDITFSNLSYQSAGSQKKVSGKMTLSADYATGGDVFNIRQTGLAQLSDLVIEDSDGYAFNFINTSPLSYANVMVFLGAGGGTIGNTSAGTPAGTNSAPALTMDSYTPAGTSAAPVLTMDSYTPAGSNSAPAFTGDALATHQHDAITAGTPSGSVAAPVLTMDSYTPAGSVAAPALTMDSYTPAGSVAAPALTMDSYTPAGSVAAPVFTASNTIGRTVSFLMPSTACSNTNSENTDSGADQTSLDAVAAYSTVAAGAWAVGAITNPSVARNVAITIKNDSGGPLNLFEGVMTFTVTGTDYKGSALSETITFTSTAGNKAVATANWRFKFGVKAFKTVTTITLDNEPDDGLKIGAGFGGVVSLYGSLATPAEADVVQVVEDGTALSITGQVDTTNKTFNFDAIAASKVISMTYLTIDGASGTNSAPAFTGNAATLTGTNSAPAFTGNAATLTGTNSAPAFTGNAATLTGTNSAPAFTGSALGTHQHAAITAGTPAGSVAAPTFTGTPATLTGTNSAPAFTGTPATLTGTVAAPTFTGAAMSTHTHTSTGGASGEAPAHTDLHLVVLDFVAYGY